MNHFICLKSSKQRGCCKGQIYVQEGDELVRYSTRWQTRLLNCDEMLSEPGLFAPVETFPRPATKELLQGCDCDECRDAKEAACS